MTTRILSPSILTALVLSAGLGCSKAADTAQGAALAAASGGAASMTSDGKIEIKTPDGTAKIDVAGDKGVATITGTNADGTKMAAAFGAGAKVPDGFPLAIMDGLTIAQGVVSEKDGKKTYAVMAQTAKPAKAVAEFYEPELKKAGLTVTRADSNMGGMVVIALNGEAGGKSMNVGIQEAGGQTTVTMGGDW